MIKTTSLALLITLFGLPSLANEVCEKKLDKCLESVVALKSLRVIDTDEALSLTYRCGFAYRCQQEK